MGSSNVPDRSRSISSTMLAGVKFRRPEAWKRLVDVWGPIIYGWCRKHGVRDADAWDLVQEVFERVFQKVPKFERGTFRGWVSTMTYRKIMDHFRHTGRHPEAIGGSSANRRFQDWPDPDEGGSVDNSGIIARADSNALIVRRVLQSVRGDFQDHTFQAFWKTAIDERPAADVAEDLGMTVSAVRTAKARVLRRLRDELDVMGMHLE